MVTTAFEKVDLHKPVILKADDTNALVMARMSLKLAASSWKGEEGYITLSNSALGLNLRW